MNKRKKIERLCEKKLHNEIRKKIETLSLRSRVTTREKYYRKNILKKQTVFSICFALLFKR